MSLRNCLLKKLIKDTCNLQFLNRLTKATSDIYAQILQYLIRAKPTHTALDETANETQQTFRRSK